MRVDDRLVRASVPVTMSHVLAEGLHSDCDASAADVGNGSASLGGRHGGDGTACAQAAAEHPNIAVSARSAQREELRQLLLASEGRRMSNATATHPDAFPQQRNVQSSVAGGVPSQCRAGDHLCMARAILRRCRAMDHRNEGGQDVNASQRIVALDAERKPRDGRASTATASTPRNASNSAHRGGQRKLKPISFSGIYARKRRDRTRTRTTEATTAAASDELRGSSGGSSGSSKTAKAAKQRPQLVPTLGDDRTHRAPPAAGRQQAGQQARRQRAAGGSAGGTAQGAAGEASRGHKGAHAAEHRALQLWVPSDTDVVISIPDELRKDCKANQPPLLCSCPPRLCAFHCVSQPSTLGVVRRCPCQPFVVSRAGRTGTALVPSRTRH